MIVNLHTFVGMYGRVIDTAQHLLAKGSEHAAASGVSEAEMLNWRLIGDMRPLAFQLSVVANFPKQWLARAADLPMPPSVGAELDVAGFRAALAEAKAYVEAIAPEQLAGRDDVPLTVAIGSMTPTMPVGQWVTGFATTNLYFHLSTAYGILRSKGVPIGKLDLFSAGL